MPWFLVEVPMSQTDSYGKCFSAHSDFQEVHSVDINDIESSNMYVDRFVKFHLNKSNTEGKVLLASEDRAYIENARQQMIRKADLARRSGKVVLLQYSSAFNNVIYSVLSEKDLTWPTILQNNTREVIIHDEQQNQRIAILRLSHTNEKFVQNKFEEFKTIAHQMTFDALKTTSPGQWILVQYSSAPFTLAFSILNERETFWLDENLYKDVVTYFKNGQNTFQAIILHKSSDIKELLKKISCIKDRGVDYFAPKEDKENLAALKHSMTRNKLL